MAVSSKNIGMPFIYLLSLCLLGLILASLLINYVVAPIYGFTTTEVQEISANIRNNGTDSNILFLKISQCIMAIGLFVFPPLFFWNFIQKDTPFTVDSSTPSPKINSIALGLILVIVVALQPLIQLLAYANESFVFPSFLANIETELKASQLYQDTFQLVLLKTDSILGLVFNLVVIAILPAIGEELLFRGSMQKLLHQKLPPHLAIWITGFIFSSIHFQFYGFLPRWIMGAGLGYLFYYSNSLWYPIVAHFTNNAFTVISVYFSTNPNDIENKPDATTLLIKLLSVPVLFFCIKIWLKKVQLPTII